ncbi:MAG TPA: alpha/beta fold hydrolase [Rhodanobacteraceae bacterium]|jgi:pimeloyl-ACP methyl ester carboxylesterase|nr:alpha/beta fold hydrolase [Rhodanobacteraceae bacterium]
MRENGGREPTVVCVHGAGGGGWEWGIWARVLAVRGFAVVAPDLMPGPRGLAKTSFLDYRSQVMDWCAGAGTNIVLAGASLGGLLALAAAPFAKPRALVLVNPMPPAGVVARPLHERYPLVVPWASERSLASTQRALPDADDAARLHALRRWRDESGTVLNDARGGIAIESPRCPVLLLASEADAEVPAAVTRALGVRFAADVRTLAGASHVGPLLGRGAAAAATEAAGWIASRTDAADA